VLRLQFYILRRLVASLALVVLVVSTILFIGQTVRLLDRMPDVGLEFVLAVLPLFLPVTLALTLPLAFLVAIILTYGRLADDNEVLAMRMAGIHPWAVAAPGVFAGLALSFFCLDLQGNLAPAAIAGQDNLRGDVYRRFLEIVQRGERNGFVSRDFKISWGGVADGDLLDLHVTRGGAPGTEVQEIHAARGVLQRDPSGGILVFTLQDAVVVTKQPGKPPTATRGSGLTFAIQASDLLSVQGGIAKPRALTYGQLLFRIFRMQPGAGARVEMEREIFGRASIALAPLCFAFCGIPLALLGGRGSRAAAAVLAFAVALAFFVLWQAGNSLASNGVLSPGPAMLAGNAILLGAGALLLRVVVRR
jgi:lipopolysaccharide export system permease protein